MPAVEEDLVRIMKRELSLAAFLPNSRELLGVVILCPKARYLLLGVTDEEEEGKSNTANFVSETG